MQDCTTSLLSVLGQALGVPLGAIPLSSCRITRPYLLERVGIDYGGTAILFSVPYVVVEDALDSRRNLSLYAVSRDYHQFFSGVEKTLIPTLKAQFPSYAFSLFADHSPIAEVEAASRCGLGIIGDNGLLITPDYGSFVFIGEVITDMPWTLVTGLPDGSFTSEAGHCEGCGACVAACPSHCLPERRDTCLSAISQNKGALSSEEEALLRSHGMVWGCDQCQLACPHNQRVIFERRDTTVSYFLTDRITHLDREVLQGMSETDFQARAYAWRGKSVLERNLSVLYERRKP